MDTRRGMFTSAHELLDRLRARQAEIGLSNEGLERICGLAAGTVNKYMGPSREKMPGLFIVACLMDALGLSGELHVDAAKVERITRLWRTEGKRRMAALRQENPRVSQAMIKRAGPEVRRQAAQKAARMKWASATPAAKAAHCAMMRSKKRPKRFARKGR